MVAALAEEPVIDLRGGGGAVGPARVGPGRRERADRVAESRPDGPRQSHGGTHGEPAGGRSGALPLAWLAEVGAANIGWEGQRKVLDQVLAWLPKGAKVLLAADRFYPSVGLFAWLHAHGWGYRLRLKRNLVVDPGEGDEMTTGDLAQGVKERYLSGVRLFAPGVSTNLGILHEGGHPEPWIIAMDCLPTRAAVLDYGAR